jgi:hypothetical protein
MEIGAPFLIMHCGARTRLEREVLNDHQKTKHFNTSLSCEPPCSDFLVGRSVDGGRVLVFCIGSSRRYAIQKITADATAPKQKTFPSCQTQRSRKFVTPAKQQNWFPLRISS